MSKKEIKDLEFVWVVNFTLNHFPYWVSNYSNEYHSANFVSVR